MKEFVLKNQKSSKDLHIDYRAELNNEQLEVVLHGDGPCLVLAGAGSGKTRTITYRVAYLIEQGVAPENILLLTFTNKAAKEMLSRVEGLLGSDVTGLWGGTFHSVANRLLRIYGRDIGFNPSFTILDQEDARGLIKVCLKDLKVDTKGRRFPSPAKLLGMISYSRNASIPLRQVVEERYANFSELIITFERVEELYAQRKLDAQSMDFDDLLLHTRDMLRKNPVLRDKLSERFQYVLVDEYQDTNSVQAEIVRQLSSVNRNLIVVGDDAQSIYSFRAAQIKNILSFPETYPGCKTFHLTTNYRSTPQILELANASIARNEEQFKKTLRAVCDDFEKPNMIPASSGSQEAQYVTEQILDLRDEGVELKDMAVLFRASSLSQRLEFELMKRDVPYEYRGGLKFFERAHIKDVVSFLKIASNPLAEISWMRVLGLYPGIGLVTAGKIFHSIRDNGTLAEIVEAPVSLSARAAAGWAKFQQTGLALAKAYPSVADMIRAVVANGYRDYLEVEYEDHNDRLDDLEQFALFAETYDDLQKFLDEVSLTETFGAGRAPKETTDEKKLVLSTIHQAKGLEWDSVFVIGLAEGRFPNVRVLEEDGGLEEERRLFYVASTRAKKRLFLSYPITSGYDTVIMNQPSQFLQELPDELIEQVRLRREPWNNASNNWGASTSSESSYDEPMIVLNDLGEKE